VTTIEESKDLE